MQEDPFWVPIDGMTNIIVVTMERLNFVSRTQALFLVDSFTSSFFADIIIVVESKKMRVRGIGGMKERHFLQCMRFRFSQLRTKIWMRRECITIFTFQH